MTKQKKGINMDRMADAIEDQSPLKRSDLLKGKQSDTSVPPKLVGKSFEEQTQRISEKETVEIEIPDCKIKPVNQRIYCITRKPTANEYKTKGGLIIATQYANPEARREGEEVNLLRYFVVAVANDCGTKFIDDKGFERGFEVGDEVTPFIPASMIHYDPTLVIDYDLGLQYVTFHESELAGVVFHKKDK